VSLVCIEAYRSNFAAVLDWLYETARRQPEAQLAVLLDYSLCRRADCDPASQTGQRDDLVAALREAGASEIATSPRRLESVLALALNTMTASRKWARRPRGDSLVEWAWASLPWQSE
jgi:hypothetical protein